jgi:mono/diheme cytochrome c family protein
MKTQNTITSLALLAVAGVCVAGVLSGCRGDRSDKPPRQFFPDMDDAPKWKPQSESDFFADGRTMRVPVTGTVAFGRQGFVSSDDWADPFMQQRADLLKDDPAHYEGTNPDGSWVEMIPATVPVDAKLLARGQERYNISCSSCHGYLGDGKGMVGQAWSYPLPNFHDAKYQPGATEEVVAADGRRVNRLAQTGLDGYIFHTARYGIAAAQHGQPAKMPGYAHALTHEDSWAIVAYIRALQAQRRGTIDDVPAQVRPDLERAARTMRMNSTTPGASPASPTTGGNQ